MIADKRFDNGNPFDWGRISEDYAKYRDIYPITFYQKILDIGLCGEGQYVLDLGTGTGVLPRNMYRHGAKFVGVDISENQILYAKNLSQNAGMDITYVVSSVEDLDFPNNTFDAVTACQCFMYFDKSIVLPKIHKLLKDGGHFCILFMAWLPDESEIANQSEQLVLKYNPAWTGKGMKRYKVEPPTELEGLFVVEHALAYDLHVSFTRENWHGRVKACRGIGASSLSDTQIQAFEEEHLAYLKTVPAVFEIPHYVTLLNLRKYESK